MKLIKSTFALATALAVGAGVAQAQTPINIALTAYVTPGSTIQSVSINNATILQKIGKAINVNLTGDRLAVNTNGAIVIINSAGAILYDLSAGVYVGSDTYLATGNFNTSTKTALINGNKVTLDYWTSGYVRADYYSWDYNGSIGFFDPIWAGTETSTNQFNVKGNALAGYIWIEYGSTAYGYNESTGQMISYDYNVSTGKTTPLPSSWEELEISDGAKAAVACALSAGVYTQSFTISASGYYWSSQYGDGVLTGTVSGSGKQTGGTTFLDPFNGSGNFSTDYNY